MQPLTTSLRTSAVALTFSALGTAAFASSHMDAPLITLDPAANTTDVYAFVDQDGDQKNLVVALGVYPFEEPGIGPNKYNFDDEVLYQIHVALDRDMRRGRPTLSYQFRFNTRFQNEGTILQSYTGVVENVDINQPDPAQNLVQTYSVTRIDRVTDTPEGHVRITQIDEDQDGDWTVSVANKPVDDAVGSRDIIGDDKVRVEEWGGMRTRLVEHLRAAGVLV